VRHSAPSLTAGEQVTVASTYDPVAGEVQLAIGTDNVDVFSILGSSGSQPWSGNDSLSVGLKESGTSIGGTNSVTGNPYDYTATDFKALSGSVPPDGALYWNDVAAVVPEPATLVIWSLLAGLGVGLGWRRRR